MAVVKRIVCLANSRKLSGRCVAGREIQDAESWVRPVSGRPTEEVSEHERRYEDGADPRLLEVVDIPLLLHCPRTYQSENWLLDPQHHWRRAGRVAWRDLDRLAENPPLLWPNGDSTFHGLNDRVAVATAETLSNSLYFLRLDEIELTVFVPGANFGDFRRRVRAGFRYRGIDYRLSLTDPVVEREYLSGKDGEYRVGDCFATVSLGEPYEGFAYKLVAALITPSRAGRS